MALYRSLPKLKEAIVWTGYNLEEVKTFFGIYLLSACLEVDDRTRQLFFRTISSQAFANIGDYLVKQSAVDYYPVVKQVFDSAYVLVE